MMNENIFLFVTNLVIIVLCGGLFMIMPQLTRKSYLFGVKIPLEQSSSPEAKALKRRYVLTCFAGASLMLIVCVWQFVVRPDLTLMATIYLPLLIIPVDLIAFIPNWKRAVRLKEERGWQVPNTLFAETSSSHTRGNLSALPWIWYVASAVIVIASVVAVIMRYPYLPGMIPAHFDINMQPTRWVETTWWSALMMPLMNAGMLALMVMTAILIEKAKLQIDPARPRLSFAQHRVYRRRMGHALGFLTLSMILFLSALGIFIILPDLPVIGAHMFWASMILMIVPVAVLIAVQIKTGQGGGKVKIEINEDADIHAPSSGRPNAGERGDDKYWVLGMFYYNPEDPAVIVEDRFGTNLGFNYARLPVKIGAAVLLLGLIALYVWMTIFLM